MSDLTKIVLVCAGEIPSYIKGACGTKLSWFQEILEPLGCTVTRHAIHENPQLLPEIGDAWIVSGSEESLMDEVPWMFDLSRALKSAVELGKPLLGICFGHQILAHTFGGSVLRNPKGWEIGSHTIKLTEAGKSAPLFRDLPSEFLVQQTHEDVVSELPPGVPLLADNNMGIQSFQIADKVFGIQFHPEFTSEVIQRYRDHQMQLGHELPHAPLAETPHSKQVLINFIAHVVEG